jgi:probable HAF family extracellular repeat protein
MPFRKSVLSLAVLLITSASLALAQGTYTQIDPPGASRTQCIGVNAAGEVSGFYQDAGGTYHGFLLSGGTYTIIDYNGEGAFVYGINDVGQVVGLSSSGGFLYDIATQTFIETINYPGASVTYPYAINNAGTIVGYFQQVEQIEGFKLVGSTYTEIAPGRGLADTYVNGITVSGELALFSSSVNSEGNFLFANGKYTKIAFDGMLPNAEVNGISRNGKALAGEYEPNGGGAVAGFLYQNKRSQELQFPGATNTFPSGVNDVGEVVGFFEDSSDNIHGFTWTPPADEEKK